MKFDNLIRIINKATDFGDETILIVSDQERTVKLLTRLFIKNEVLSNVSVEQITNKIVVGNLPLYLIKHCKEYIPFEEQDSEGITGRYVNGKQEMTRCLVRDILNSQHIIKEGEEII